MAPQRLGRVEVACQFRLAQRRMHLPVTDVMHQHGRAALATFQLGDQMVQALRHIRRDRTQAERARGVGHGFMLDCICWAGQEGDAFPTEGK